MIRRSLTCGHCALKSIFIWCFPSSLVIMKKPSLGTTLAIIIGILLFGTTLRGYVFNHQLAQGLASDDRERFITLYIENIITPHTAGSMGFLWAWFWP